MPCFELGRFTSKGRGGKEQRVPWVFPAAMGALGGGGAVVGSSRMGEDPGRMNSEGSWLHHAEWREQ